MYWVLCKSCLIVGPTCNSRDKVAEIWNTRTESDQITQLEKDKAELLHALHAIQSACIGEIAMGYKLGAESIGSDISKATGMTHPELTEYLK